MLFDFHGLHGGQCLQEVFDQFSESEQLIVFYLFMLFCVSPDTLLRDTSDTVKADSQRGCVCGGGGLGQK